VRVIVTGAAGFIGAHVLKKMTELGFEAIGLDNFSSYYSVDYKHKRLEALKIDKSNYLIECDISNYSKVEETISALKPKYVIHLAGQAGVRLSLIESNAYITSNIEGFQNIIRSSIINDVSGILYASSSSVYGDSSPIPFKENSESLRPKSIYGVTKLSNEMFAEIHSKSSGIRFRGIRFFTVYGPWGRPDMAYFRIAAAALGQGKFTLFGDGSIQRDFTYIDDVVTSTVMLFQDLIHREEGFNDIINLGGGRPLDMNYLIQIISNISGKILKINKQVESNLDSRVTMADNSYLKSILGDLKFTDLEVGVEKLMDWAKQDFVKSQLLKWTLSAP
jgi:UDP-glucuronate 4-epimerase